MLYILFMIPALLLAFFAQWRVSSTYQKYAQVRNAHNLTGLDVARVLMRNEGLEHVRIEHIPGELTDHYDPRDKVMRLSAGSQSPSVAAMAVVAHELGHAKQDSEGYVWLRLRSGIVGIANIGSSLGMTLAWIGVLMATLAGGRLGFMIAMIGVVLMSAAVAFTLVTLPVELNASARARDMLARNGLVTVQESQGVSAVLNAAALTYIAAAAQAVLQLFYWITVLGGLRRNN